MYFANVSSTRRDVALHGLLPDDVRPIPPSKVSAELGYWAVRSPADLSLLLADQEVHQRHVELVGATLLDLLDQGKGNRCHGRSPRSCSSLFLGAGGQSPHFEAGGHSCVRAQPHFPSLADSLLPSTAWIDGRHGFAETHFAWTSTEGEYKKTAHETLGIYRFCRDLVRWRGDKTSFPQ